jgi:UrcA family protein
MRPFAIVCGLLLAACPATAALAHDDTPAPQARFVWGDLDLRSRAGQDELVVRVARAAADYCRDHAAVVTPHHRRADPQYCPATMRVQMMWAMPRPVRLAYDAGWRRRPA